VKKVERGIDVGAVMGAHGKRGQIVEVTCPGRIHGLFFRHGITGIDSAGENLLTDINDFLHGCLLFPAFSPILSQKRKAVKQNNTKQQWAASLQKPPNIFSISHSVTNCLFSFCPIFAPFSYGIFHLENIGFRRYHKDTKKE
jgi:hypothetical protein